MGLSTDEIKEANRRRIDEQNESKAEKYLAVRNAEEATALMQFSQRHRPGTNAQLHGSYHSCDANDALIGEWLEQRGLRISFENLESAYQDLKGSFAEAPAESYERKTNTRESRGPISQAPKIKLPDEVAPWTRDEILAWPAETLKKHMSRGPRNVAAINKILANKN